MDELRARLLALVSPLLKCINSIFAHFFVCCSQGCMCACPHPSPPLAFFLSTCVQCWGSSRPVAQDTVAMAGNARAERTMGGGAAAFVLPLSWPSHVKHYFSDCSPFTPLFSIPTGSTSILHLILTCCSLHFSSLPPWLPSCAFLIALYLFSYENKQTNKKTLDTHDLSWLESFMWCFLCVCVCLNTWMWLNLNQSAVKLVLMH